MTGPPIQPPPGTTPPSWTPPDDDWDRPVLRLRTAWLAGIGMVAGGSAIAVFGLASLLGSIGTDGSGWLAFGLVALAGGVAAIRYSPLLSRMVNRLDRPWVPAACWMALFLLRLITGSHLPQFTFWRS